MTITQQQKDWTVKAIENGFTKLQIKKKLQESNYKDDKILEIYEFYDSIIGKYTIVEKKDIKKEKEFEGIVKKYLEGESYKLSWSEKRAVKSFLKNVTKYNETLKSSLKMIKEEIIKIKEKFGDSDKTVKEREFLKLDLIDRIVESKEIIDVYHPITGEEATKENLKDLTLEQLILILEDNVEILQLTINGKTE